MSFSRNEGHYLCKVCLRKGLDTKFVENFVTEMWEEKES